MSTKEPILTLSHLCYGYDGAQNALDDFSLCISAGEKIAVLGNNGAGKSTFFLCCNGVLQPQSGDMFLGGERITRKAKSLTQLRTQVGLVFQDADTQLLAGTVEAEVSFGPMNLRLPKETVRQRVEDALSGMGLVSYRHRAPQYLSGGEKKRVTLADVLAMQPRVLLLDEPASSLDPANATLLERTLGELTAQDIALVIATHDVNFAWRWADRILLMHQGKLVADDVPERIFGQTELLKQCGLSQPILWQVAQVLQITPPRSVEALNVDSIFSRDAKH